MLTFAPSVANPGATFPTLENELGGLQRRAATINAEVNRALEEFSVLPFSALRERLKNSENAKLRDEVCQRHLSELYDAYLEHKDPEEAAFHADCISYLGYKPKGDDANNLGYLALARGKYPEARIYFNECLSTADKPEGRLLATYNLAMVDAAEGNIEEALRLIDWCVEVGKDIAKKVRGARCLMRPHLEEVGAVVLKEEMGELDIWRFAKDAKRLLTRH